METRKFLPVLMLLGAILVFFAGYNANSQSLFFHIFTQAENPIKVKSLNHNIVELKKSFSEQLQNVFIYGQPKVSTEENGSILLSSLDTEINESGLGFNYVLNPKVKYKIVITGNGTKQLNLRLKKDNEYKWYTAPKGATEFVLSDVTYLEVLIYGRGKYYYNIDTIKIFPFGNDGDLKQIILNTIPSLPALLKKEPLVAAQLLNDWAANHLLWQEISAVKTPDLDILSASTIFYEYFMSAKAGVYCGGAAAFAAKVMQLFDIPAFPIGIGYRNTSLTHVIVLVPVKNQHGKWDFYLFDPTYNLTFTNRNSGKSASVKDMIYWYRNNALAANVTITQMPLNNRHYLLSDISKVPPNSYINIQQVNGYNVGQLGVDTFYADSMKNWASPGAKKLGFQADGFLDIHLLAEGDILDISSDSPAALAFQQLYHEMIKKS